MINPNMEHIFELAASEATCGFIDDETLSQNLPSYQELEDEFQQQVNKAAETLVQPSNKCHPYGVTIHNNTEFIFYNIFEALQNLPEETQKEIHELWIKALSDSKFYPIKIFHKLDQAIREYWQEEATRIAEILVETSK